MAGIVILLFASFAMLLHQIRSKPPSFFVHEIDKTRLALAIYYKTNGHFPQSVNEIDPTLEGSDDLTSTKFNGDKWHYGAREDSYVLWKYTFLRTVIKFEFDVKRRKESGWFLDKDDGLVHDLPEFGFSDAEENLLDNSTKN